MYFSRQHLEDLEDRNLAPYACQNKFSKGRLYPEEEHEYRMAYQRDRDRILHTTAFRRLEYKTQVFINYEGDYYRTRLTHTLEVSQIGRSIALALGANETLTEAICLVHDIGHPAFGHSGETTLRKLMKNHGGFDHNQHSLRVVTELEKRYPEFPGLNLTWEVLEGIVKHETEYDDADASQFNPELRGHIEAQITNCADELAYTAHDLDDGLRSNMITAQMLKEIELWRMVIDSIGWKGEELDEINRHRIIRRLIGLEVNNLIQQTSQQIDKSAVKSVDELQRLPYNVVGFTEEMRAHNRQIKDFLFNNLYHQYRVMRMAVKAERIISDLFNAYLKEPAILPTHVQGIIKLRGMERTICDYIAGMTDRYAIEEHKKLFDSSILP